MGGKLPFMKLFPDDYIADTANLTPLTSGFWWRCLLHMHKREDDRGRLHGTAMDYAILYPGITADEAETCIRELQEKGTADVKCHTDVTPLSWTMENRRMIREEEKRSDAAKRKREQRARQGEDDVTPMSQGCHKDVTPDVTSDVTQMSHPMSHDSLARAGNTPRIPESQKPREAQTPRSPEAHDPISSATADSPNSDATAPPVAVRADHAGFMQAWNTMAEGTKGIIRPIRKMSEKRKTALRARWGDEDWRDHWQEALSRIPTCAFLMGEGSGGWVADADFFLRPDSVDRILEGKYDNGRTTAAPKSSRHFDHSPEQAGKFDHGTFTVFDNTDGSIREEVR